MKLKYFGVFYLIIGVTSYTWAKSRNPQKSIVKDTLHYSYKTFKERAEDCGNKPDSNCTRIDLKYPVFTTQKMLNDTIKSRLISTFYIDGKKDNTVDGMAKHFFDFYREDTKSPNSRGAIYELDINLNVLKQDLGIATLQLTGYTYLGGAHGGSSISFINWNTKTDRKITFSDIFIYGYQEKLRRIAEKIFRQNEKLSATASLADDYFFKDNKFVLNDNFLITQLGIRFLYNEYEIKPYAAGTTDLFIPYQQIKSLLKPHTVVSQYIK